VKRDDGDKKVSREDLMRIMQRFAGNTAHDMNNVLTPIVGFGRMLHERLTDEDDIADLHELLTAAERGMKLCGRYGEMANFSHAETLPGDVVFALRSAETMFGKKLGDGVTIKWHLPSEPIGALFDPVQIFMVLDHIASNAGKAMSAGSAQGTFTVSLAEPSADGELVVTFADTGRGFPEEVLKKFGLPFNTDGHEHKLSGTGLALCRSAVMEWGGQLRAENTDEGAQLILTLLPGVVGKTNIEPAAPTAAPAKPNALGCVLLLESDEAESERMAADLRSSGYDVHTTLDAVGERPFDFGLIALGFPDEMDHLVTLKAHSPEAVLYRMAAGMTGGLFITKPATKESLLKKLCGK